jgi:hypothetical protein
MLQERDRITITNVLKDFGDLVCEIVEKASTATVSENVKNFMSRYKASKK